MAFQKRARRSTKSTKSASTRISNRDIEDIIDLYPIGTRQTALEVAPGIQALWDYKKNCGFGPDDFARRSSVKAWFKCSQNKKHFYKSIIGVVCQSLQSEDGNGCPFCAGKRVHVSNSLASLYPEIAKEFDSKKNGTTADQIIAHSSKKAWFLCRKCSHSWEAAICSRTCSGAGCFRCNVGLKTDLRDYPQALAQFAHKNKNNKGVDPYQLPWHSKVHWQCPEAKDHKWVSTFNRREGERCPYCKGSRSSTSNHLGLVPEFKKQFHPTKNGAVTLKDITMTSSRPVWWICPVSKDHEWQVSPRSRQDKGTITACPFCSPYGKNVAYSNSFAKLYPEKSKLWHPTKNGKLTAKNVRPFSSQSIWFKCASGHEWQAALSAVTGSTAGGCPYCDHKMFSPDQSLAKAYPEIAKQWHKEKNGSLTPSKIAYYARQKVWFKCPKGSDHEWQVQLCIRTRAGTGCPFCKMRRVSLTNCVRAMRPEIAKIWHPTKNGKLTPDNLVYGSRKEIWFKCKNGHQFKRPLISMTRRGGRCLDCLVKVKQAK